MYIEVIHEHITVFFRGISHETFLEIMANDMELVVASREPCR